MSVILQQRDQDVLQALCEDRAECGRGVPRKELEAIASTRWLDRVLQRLRDAGHLIGSVGLDDERFQLLDPLDAERATDESGVLLSVAGKDDQARVPRPVGGSLGAGTLFELDPTPHWRQERAA
jgi:hypothetical protein